jgi:hypothetical protein
MTRKESVHVQNRHKLFQTFSVFRTWSHRYGAHRYWRLTEQNVPTLEMETMEFIYPYSVWVNYCPYRMFNYCHQELSTRCGLLSFLIWIFLGSLVHVLPPPSENKDNSLNHAFPQWEITLRWINCLNRISRGNTYPSKSAVSMYVRLNGSLLESNSKSACN